MQEEDEIFDFPPSPIHPDLQPSPPLSPPLPPLPPPPPPFSGFSSPPLRQPILIYSQMHHPTEYQATRCFYDPNTLYNQHGFTIEGDTEYIILIQGVGFEQNDNHIFPAAIHVPHGPLEVHTEHEPHSVCLLLRHLGPDVNLTVAPRTSLAFLLENSRVSVRMCYITNVAEFVLRHDQSSIVTGPMAPPRSNYLTTYSPYLRTTTTVAQQAASSHPLLLRRLINLPRRGSSPPLTTIPTTK